MKFILIISILSILNSCGGFVLKENYIDGPNLKEGFSVEKLINVTQDDKGIPSSFKVDSSMEFNTKNLKNHRVYFYKKNNYDYWMFKNPFSLKTYDILQINFYPGNWYCISQLRTTSNPDYYIYFYVKEDGSFDKYNEYAPGPW